MSDAFSPRSFEAPSSIPRVVGILAIIFSVIGLGIAAIFFVGPMGVLERRTSWDHHKVLQTWMIVWGLSSLVLFVLHLAGGILGIMNRTLGLRVLTAYAIAAIVLVVLDVVVLGFYAQGRAWDKIGMPHLGYSFLAVAWPIVALVLVNTRRARAAAR
jgi:hypothetical protein